MKSIIILFTFAKTKIDNNMKKRVILTIVIFASTISSMFGQSESQKENFKHFIGSTFFMIANVFPNPPHYYQLNYGYRLTSKDVISIEAITWEYNGPLGRPYGSDYGSDNSNFAGSIKAFGVGLVYKRFLWEGLYAAIHSTAFHQNYLDLERKKIQSGFQLFNTLRFGYHLKLFKNRFFIEPSIAFTYWPINTNLPNYFQVEEDKWPNYFLLEPGLHFGINF